MWGQWNVSGTESTPNLFHINENWLQFNRFEFVVRLSPTQTLITWKIEIFAFNVCLNTKSTQQPNKIYQSPRKKTTQEIRVRIDREEEKLCVCFSLSPSLALSSLYRLLQREWRENSFLHGCELEYKCIKNDTRSHTKRCYPHSCCFAAHTEQLFRYEPQIQATLINRIEACR